MEGVGARLGRSSSRYSGPAVIFSGPVRKWKKKWVPIKSPNNVNGNHHQSAANNGGNASHLLLYKWTPVSTANGGSPSEPVAKDAEDAAGEKAAKRMFRYVPMSITEEKKQDTVKLDDESKDGSDDEMAQDNSPNTKAEINGISMLDLKDSDQEGADVQEDASKTHLDLNLGLKSHDGKNENDLIQDDNDSMMNPTETGNRGKRKIPDLEMRM